MNMWFSVYLIKYKESLYSLKNICSTISGHEKLVSMHVLLPTLVLYLNVGHLTTGRRELRGRGAIARAFFTLFMCLRFFRAG